MATTPGPAPDADAHSDSLLDSEETPDQNANDLAATPGGELKEWVYLGPHWRDNGRWAWRDPEGETLGFKKVRARLFGGIYTVRVHRTEDVITVYGTPTWTGRHTEDAAEIQARATKRETHLQEQRLERSTSRTATIDAALTDLVDLAAPMTTDAAGCSSNTSPRRSTPRNGRPGANPEANPEANRSGENSTHPPGRPDDRLTRRSRT